MTKLSARLATFLLVALMILGFTAAPILAAGDKGFSDVPKSEWFYGYVTMLHDEGIVHGYGSTGEFRPMNKLTREHAAKMIARAAGLPYQGKKANFPDVDKDGEMSPYIAAMVDQGAIQGFPDGRFQPEDTISRGHAAKMVQLAFGLKASTLPVSFTDLPSHDPVVSKAIRILASNGIVKGYENAKNFKPDQPITRSQMAKLLCIAMVTSAVEEAETSLARDVIARAQGMVDGLPDDQDQATRAFLQERLDALKEVEPDPGDPDPSLEKHTVTFKLNDKGTAKEWVYSVNHGDTITGPSLRFSQQDIWSEWHIGSLEGAEWDRNAPVTSDLTLYGQITRKIDEGTIGPIVTVHTVTFKLNDKGTAKEWVNSVNHGDTITGPPLRFSQQDIWSEWHIGSLEGAEWDRNAPVKSDLTLYGKITRKIDGGTIGPIVTVHTVTFKLNDKGTAKEWVYSVNHGDTITGPSLRFSQQDIWSEWHIGSLEGAEWDRNAPVTSDLTLYGQITRKIDEGTIGPIVTVHTVTFKLNDKGTAKEWVNSVNHGDTITGPPLRFSQQDIWSEWHIGSLEGAEWDRNAPVKSDLTLYGKITRKIDGGTIGPIVTVHTVTFKLNDKGTAKEWVYSVNHGDTIKGPPLMFSQQDVWSEWHIGSLEGAEWDRNAPVKSDLTLYGQITRKIDDGAIGPIDSLGPFK